MEFTAEDAKVAIRAAWAILSSPLAQRVYVVAIGAAVLLGSFLGAKKGIGLIQAHAAQTPAKFSNLRQGRRPQNAVQLSRKIAKLIAVYLGGLFGASKGSMISVTCGVLIPAATLFAMTFAYPWFDDSTVHLINASHHPVPPPNLSAAGLFVADQTLRGGLFDLIEIFAVDIAEISNNPANLPFSFGLFAYHLYVEGFVFTGLFLLARNAWILGLKLVEEIRFYNNGVKTGWA